MTSYRLGDMVGRMRSEELSRVYPKGEGIYGAPDLHIHILYIFTFTYLLCLVYVKSVSSRME